MTKSEEIARLDRELFRLRSAARAASDVLAFKDSDVDMLKKKAVGDIEAFCRLARMRNNKEKFRAPRRRLTYGLVGIAILLLYAPVAYLIMKLIVAI